MSLRPTPPVPVPLANMGASVPRYEARSKVTGAPIYAGDVAPQDTLHAVVVTSGIAKGRITAIDVKEAERLPGVVRVYTHLNAPRRQPVGFAGGGGYGSTSHLPLTDATIHHAGQIVAMVVAESFETARRAAQLIKPPYASSQPSALIDSAGAETIAYARANPKFKEQRKGDAEAALASAPVTVDQEYRTPTQHHNAIELFNTTAAWDGDELTIWEPSQYVYGLKNAAAQQFGLPVDKVRVISPFVGGAFGAKAMITPRTGLVAGAARELGRPVRIEVSRQQGFDLVLYRAETRQRVRLGAERTGKLTAYAHESWELTSRLDDFTTTGTKETVEMWNAENILTRTHLVRADRGTPGPMRAPPVMTTMFALETAMDELAIKLGMDPIELRRVNDTKVSPVTGLPYSSRSVMKCFDEAASSFGWARRNPTPGSMRDGDWLVGFGAAMAMHKSNLGPSSARVRLTSDSAAHVQTAAQDVGTGAATVLAQVASEALKLPYERVTIEIGDSRLPPGSVAGGSRGTASAGSAVHAACAKIAARFGGKMPEPAALGAAFDRLGVGAIEEYGEWAPGADIDAIKRFYKGQFSAASEEPEPPKFSFGAEFVEVRIHARTREIRVPRMTGAFAAGRILNPRTARSQLLGGMIWGMGSALLEATECDPRTGHYVNADIAEYLVATNADIPQVDIILVPETDKGINPIGVKSIGELGNVGTAAAISNAVYHATGKRIRDLPITIEKLL